MAGLDNRNQDISRAGQSGLEDTRSGEDLDRPRISRIVFMITRADDLGGAQAHVLDLALGLLERDYKVMVLAGGGGKLFESLEKKAVPCRKLEKLVHPISPFQDWAAFKETRALLQEIKPDLLSTHSNKAGFLGRLAARTLNIPVVHTSHGFLFSGRDNSPAGRFYRLMEKFAARAGTKVIAVSESEFAAARKLQVIPPQKMAVVHNGLPDLGPEFLAEPGLDPPRLVMVARFASPKDHLTLIKALGGLKEKDWSLDLIGEGPGLDQARRTVRRLDLSERINFRGLREDVPLILAQAQIFVLSSKREGFPISILEAMRAGLPVVASRVGGCGEAVREGENGCLFAPGDVEALRGCLAGLIEKAALRRSMGEAGRRRYLKDFTLEQMIEKTLVVYESVI